MRREGPIDVRVLKKHRRWLETTECGALPLPFVRLRGKDHQGSDKTFAG